MNKVISLILLSIIFYSFSFAQQKLYGHKFSGNGDILSDIISIQNGFVLDSISNRYGLSGGGGQITYHFEYDEKRILKRDINFFRIHTIEYINGRPKTKYLPGTRDYYYNKKGEIDSLGNGHFADGLWINDSSGYKYNYYLNGKVKSKTYSTKDIVQEIETYFYDSTGNLLFDTLINFSTKDTLITCREYDSQNRLTVLKSIKNGSLNGYLKTYTYDSSGNINCRVKYMENGDTIFGGYNFFFEVDEMGKVVDEIFSLQLRPDSTWGNNIDIGFKYNEDSKILEMAGGVVRFQYNADGNLDSLINTHSVYCGYLGTTATLVDSYGNIIKLPDCSGFNYFYYSSMVAGINTNPVTDKSFKLFQNYPNPFNPTTTISFTLPSNSMVSLTIFDMLGRKIASLLDNETMPAGKYSKQWNASGCSSGIYFYQLKAGAFTDTKKLLLIR